jgi:hypothetical protein
VTDDVFWFLLVVVLLLLLPRVPFMRFPNHQ